MFTTVASVLLPLATAIGSMTPAAQPELLQDPVVLSFCRVLAAKAADARFGEQGAFVVRSKDGLLYFVAWPPAQEKDLLRWYGRFPEGTVAILHTHEPSLWSASKLDTSVARRMNIPVYVITPRRITKTVGGPTMIVREGEWALAGK